MTISGKARPTISRRGVLRYGAVAGAAAAVSPTFADTAHASGLPRPLPAPRPIRGGSQIPNGPLIHVFAPGPEGLTLPFTGVVLEGRDVEPGVITDFNGASAVAFHVGTATGSDGKQYNLETDIRAMEGDYVAVDGTRRRGLFVLI
jgi:hypothetical protein